MKISVITPCFNSERYIEETIESVLGQRGDFDIEYIIIDGGSTDDTVSIVRRYKNLVESGSFPVKCREATLTYISEKDEGMYDAIVKGFRLATGDVVAYINSDDFYLPNAFSIVTEIFQKYSDVDWLTGMQTSYNENGQIIDCFLPSRFSKRLIRKGIYGTVLPFIQQESTVWRKKLLDCLDFDLLKTYRLAGDFYIWYTFSKKADLYIAQGCLGGFRIHAGQASRQGSEYLGEFISIAEKRGIVDVTGAYLLCGVTYFMPSIIKKKLNNKIIYYEDGRWLRRGMER